MLWAILLMVHTLEMSKHSPMHSQKRKYMNSDTREHAVCESLYLNLKCYQSWPNVKVRFIREQSLTPLIPT